MWLHRRSQPWTVCPPWLQPQVCGGEPTGTANPPGEASHPFWRPGSRAGGITAQGHPHPLPRVQETWGSNFKVMAPWLGPQVMEQKGPRDHLIQYPSLQARKLRVPPCPRSHSSTSQGLKTLPSWVYTLLPSGLSSRLRLPLVGREGHVVK